MSTNSAVVENPSVPPQDVSEGEWQVVPPRKKKNEEDSPLTGQKNARPPSAYDARRKQWEEEQHSLKQKLITRNHFSWTMEVLDQTPLEQPQDEGAPQNSWAKLLFPAGKAPSNGQVEEERETLKLVGGVDLSFFKGNKKAKVAIAALVVLSFPSLEVVYRTTRKVNLEIPYIAGFLGFREVPALLELVEDLKKNAPQFVPQVILVDGNGILHQRGFGAACHLGVLADIPTIGVAKKLLVVDGITEREVDRLVAEHLNAPGEAVELRGKSGKVHGVVMRANGNQKPIFVSVGHKIGLETAIEVVRECMRNRIPEPIHLADTFSREEVARLEPPPSSKAKGQRGKRDVESGKGKQNNKNGQGQGQGQGRGQGQGKGKGRTQIRPKGQQTEKGQSESADGNQAPAKPEGNGDTEAKPASKAVPAKKAPAPTVNVWQLKSPAVQNNPAAGKAPIEGAPKQNPQQKGQGQGRQGKDGQRRGNRGGARGGARGGKTTFGRRNQQGSQNRYQEHGGPPHVVPADAFDEEEPVDTPQANGVQDAPQGQGKGQRRGSGRGNRGGARAQGQRNKKPKQELRPKQPAAQPASSPAQEASAPLESTQAEQPKEGN